MNKIVELYLSRKNVKNVMDVVQFATAPGITFVLKDFNPAVGATARIFIKKKDSEVYNTCTLVGNEATFNPSTTTFDEVGECIAQLEVVSEGKIAVSYMIYVTVEPNIIDSSAIEAVDDFSALQDAIIAVGDISEYKQQTDVNTDSIDAIEQKTDKLSISNSTSTIYLGNTVTDYIRIYGDATNKIAVGVYNTVDNAEYRLLAKADNMITLYNMATSSEVYRLYGQFLKGSNTITACVGAGYATTNGTYYFFLDTLRDLYQSLVISNVKITEATIRGVNGVVTSSADLTNNVVDMIRGSSGKPRVQLQNLTNNFVANTPAFITCTLEFTIS